MEETGTEGVLPDVLADASPSARAELEHGCFHLFQLRGRRFQPALGAECVRVGEELWVHVREVG